MQLHWLGQFTPPVCPPGSFADPFTRICVSPTQGQVPAVTPGAPTPQIPTVIPEVTITPTGTRQEEKSRTLVYAAAIVGAGIVTALVLSRVA